MVDEIADGTSNETISFDYDPTKTTYVFRVNRSIGTAILVKATTLDGKPFEPDTSKMETLQAMALRVADDQAQR